MTASDPRYAFARGIDRRDDLVSTTRGGDEYCTDVNNFASYSKQDSRDSWGHSWFGSQ